MKKFAWAITVAMVLGFSASAFAGVTFGGKAYTEIKSDWSGIVGEAPAKNGKMEINQDFELTLNGSNSDKDKGWSYNAAFGTLYDAGTHGADHAINLGAFKVEVKDPLFTAAVWGKKQSYSGKTDVFGWIAPQAVKNSANSDSNAMRARIEAKGVALDLDNNNTAWLNYSQKVGNMTVGVAAASKVEAQKQDQLKTVGVFAKSPVGPVNVEGEVAMTMGGGVKEDNLALGAKAAYDVSANLKTNAWLWSRGANFTHFTNTVGKDDRTEYGASATYTMGDVSVTGSYTGAFHTTLDDKDKKTDNGAISATVKYAPKTGPTGSASVAITTQDKNVATDLNNKVAITITGTVPLLADALKITGTYKSEKDPDGGIDPAYKDLADADLTGSDKGYTDTTVTATYNLDSATTISGGISMVDFVNKDKWAKQNLKIARTVSGATVAAEYIGWQFNIAAKTSGKDKKESRTIVSLTVPL